jgi:myo-inositol 2-dehydrogenase/D-chiro-inositol 1-dehydrogenase
VEQNIHVIDICNWILKAHPLRASASGGRQGRPADGDVYGNYNVLFHYPEGVDVTFSSTQFAKGWWDVTERFFGTKGTSLSPYIGPLGIWGDDSPIGKRRRHSLKASLAVVSIIRPLRALSLPSPA